MLFDLLKFSIENGLISKAKILDLSFSAIIFNDFNNAILTLSNLLGPICAKIPECRYYEVINSSCPRMVIYPQLEYGSTYFQPFMSRPYIEIINENKQLLSESLVIALKEFFVWNYDVLNDGRKVYYIKNKLSEIRKRISEEYNINESNIFVLPYIRSTEENMYLDEGFGEFFASLVMRSLGYLVIPTSPVGNGVPDLSAWKPPILDKLHETGFIDGGILVEELGMLRVLRKIKNSNQHLFKEELNAKAVVLEVESSFKRRHNGLTQLYSKPGYLLSGHYDKGFLVYPGEAYEIKDVGVIALNNDTINFIDAEKKWSDEDKIREGLNVVNLIAKKWLMMNFTIDELKNITGASSFYSIVKKFLSFTDDQIINYIDTII